MINMIRKIYYKFREYRYRHDVKVKAKGFSNTPESITTFGRINFNDCKVKIGDQCSFWRNVSFNNGEIVIGNNVAVGENSIFFSHLFEEGGGVVIGSNVMIAANVMFYDSDHGMDISEDMIFQKSTIRKIVVEDNVWIGAGAIILKGSYLKRGCVIGAGAVVKGIIPENAIVGGIPAKLIRYR